MAISYEIPKVPVIDPTTGRFPDKYAPPSVAADADRAEQALAGVPAAVDGALATQVQAATDAAGQAQTSAEAAAQAADSRIAAGLASGGVIKTADDATLSAAKSYADSGVAQVNTRFLRGSGSPVGVITPTSAGVQYVDLAATNGARVWVSTGTTSNAWSVVNGDTGRRDITSLLAPALGTWSSVLLRRLNESVIFSFSDINATHTTKAFFTLPMGFTPRDGQISTPIFPPNPTELPIAGGHIYITWDGADSSIIGTNRGCEGYITWATRDPWPTTLPGTPS